MLLREPPPTQADLHFRLFGFPVRQPVEVEVADQEGQEDDQGEFHDMGAGPADLLTRCRDRSRIHHPLRGEVEQPGQDKCDGKTDGGEDKQRGYRRFRQPDRRHDDVRHLQQHPGARRIDGGHPVDAPAFQFSDELA